MEYDVSELNEIVLAYATTIHKAQGAEYPIEVMPVMMTHYAMLQRNLNSDENCRMVCDHAEEPAIYTGTTEDEGRD